MLSVILLLLVVNCACPKQHSLPSLLSLVDGKVVSVDSLVAAINNEELPLRYCGVGDNEGSL